ncbi:MAG: YbaB/EbfC family nucleoid-associated protein [Pseudonocardia sp.]
MDAQAWLDDYRQRIFEIGRQARDAQERIGAVTANVTSPDGSVTVTVGAGGALSGLVIHEAAQRLSRIQLAEAVVASVARARAEAGRAAADAVAPLLGERSAAMAYVRARTDGSHR